MIGSLITAVVIVWIVIPRTTTYNVITPNYFHVIILIVFGTRAGPENI